MERSQIYKFVRTDSSSLIKIEGNERYNEGGKIFFAEKGRNLINNEMKREGCMVTGH